MWDKVRLLHAELCESTIVYYCGNEVTVLYPDLLEEEVGEPKTHSI